jgi:hypothetical protein
MFGISAATGEGTTELARAAMVYLSEEAGGQRDAEKV